MKTISMEALNEAQKQNYFISTLKKRGWDIWIEWNGIFISTVGRRRIYFNFHEGYKWIFKDKFISFEDIQLIINEAYEAFREWDLENSWEDEGGYSYSALDSWEGFLDSPQGIEISKLLLDLNFWFWGESISYSWVNDEDVNSSFYAENICDLLGLKYTQYKLCNKILDCWELSFPLDWMS